MSSRPKLCPFSMAKRRSSAIPWPPKRGGRNDSRCKPEAALKPERDESAAKFNQPMEEIAALKQDKAEAQAKLTAQGEKNQDLAW